MAEMVTSAVIQETASQILSNLVHRYGGKDRSSAAENFERLEMAHIKMEAALEISGRWQITDTSLLRWRKKLKRAAQECNDALHKCNQRILEEQQVAHDVGSSSFPKQIAHATKSFILSAFSRNHNESSRSIIRRFERFADGAGEFMRFVELGGTPRRHRPFAFNSLTNHLLDGKELHHKIVRGNEDPFFLLSVVPFSTAEHGIEVGLTLIHKDGNAPQNNFFLSVMLQLSESTDIIGVAFRCLQLYSPFFRSTVEFIQKELAQILMQDLDFSWVPYVDSCQKRHWDNMHSFVTQWFRPDPLCCKQHDQFKLCHSSKSGLPDVSLEPVIEMNLQCQASLSQYNKRRTLLSECRNSQQHISHLNVGLTFMPHASSEDMLPADTSSAIAAIDGEKRHCLHRDITLEQVEEIMLPKATDFFLQNTEATVYQMLWTSKHGTAYIQVEKESMRAPGTLRGSRKRKLLQPQDQGNGAHVICHFLNLWVAQVPVRLQSSIMDWMQKEEESQLAARQLHLKL